MGDDSIKKSLLLLKGHWPYMPQMNDEHQDTNFYRAVWSQHCRCLLGPAITQRTQHANDFWCTGKDQKPLLSQPCGQWMGEVHLGFLTRSLGFLLAKSSHMTPQSPWDRESCDPMTLSHVYSSPKMIAVLYNWILSTSDWWWYAAYPTGKPLRDILNRQQAFQSSLLPLELLTYFLCISLYSFTCAQHKCSDMLEVNDGIHGIQISRFFAQDIIYSLEHVQRCKFVNA